MCEPVGSEFSSFRLEGTFSSLAETEGNRRDFSQRRDAKTPGKKRTRRGELEAVQEPGTRKPTRGRGIGMRIRTTRSSGEREGETQPGNGEAQWREEELLRAVHHRARGLQVHLDGALRGGEVDRLALLDGRLADTGHALRGGQESRDRVVQRERGGGLEERLGARTCGEESETNQGQAAAAPDRPKPVLILSIGSLSDRWPLQLPTSQPPGFFLEIGRTDPGRAGHSRRDPWQRACRRRAARRCAASRRR